MNPKEELLWSLWVSIIAVYYTPKPILILQAPIKVRNPHLHSSRLQSCLCGSSGSN